MKPKWRQGSPTSGLTHAYHTHSVMPGPPPILGGSDPKTAGLIMPHLFVAETCQQGQLAGICNIYHG